jgi:hypothetical protein
MEKSGLGSSISKAVAQIAEGRKGLETDGREHEGRLSFEDGIAEARAIFKEVFAGGDVELILLAEYLFITQELEESEDDEVEGRSCAVAAIASFDDAFLSLKVLRNSISRPGLSRLDRTLAKERINAVTATQDIYFGKQQAAML